MVSTLRTMESSSWVLLTDSNYLTLPCSDRVGLTVLCNVHFLTETAATPYSSYTQRNSNWLLMLILTGDSSYWSDLVWSGVILCDLMKSTECRFLLTSYGSSLPNFVHEPFIWCNDYILWHVLFLLFHPLTPHRIARLTPGTCGADLSAISNEGSSIFLICILFSHHHRITYITLWILLVINIINIQVVLLTYLR